MPLFLYIEPKQTMLPVLQPPPNIMCPRPILSVDLNSHQKLTAWRS